MPLCSYLTTGSSVAWADDAFLVWYILHIAKVLGRLYIYGAAPVHADNTIVHSISNIVVVISITAVPIP